MYHTVENMLSIWMISLQMLFWKWIQFLLWNIVTGLVLFFNNISIWLICLQKKHNQSYFYIGGIYILFISVIDFVSFILCNFESAIDIVPIYVININYRWMVKKIYFMWIFLFSVCLLSNVFVGLSVNYIIWCMIDEELQVKV